MDLDLPEPSPEGGAPTDLGERLSDLFVQAAALHFKLAAVEGQEGVGFLSATQAAAPLNPMAPVPSRSGRGRARCTGSRPC